MRLISVRQRAGLEGLDGAEVQGADRGGRPGEGDASGYGALLYDVSEACDLVRSAASHALAPERPGASVYVLNMGQPVRIVELAERMILLSRLQPGYDIEIVFTEIRPGERVNEIWFASEEPPVEIGLAGVMAVEPNEPPMQTLQKRIAGLDQAIDRDDPVIIKTILKDAVPEFGSRAA
jgi:FlaA1/EpsC-like NDP-sugar epimerase